jgi:hypothetical protein
MCDSCEAFGVKFSLRRPSEARPITSRCACGEKCGLRTFELCDKWLTAIRATPAGENQILIDQTLNAIVDMAKGCCEAV